MNQPDTEVTRKKSQGETTFNWPESAFLKCKFQAQSTGESSVKSQKARPNFMAEDELWAGVVLRPFRFSREEGMKSLQSFQMHVFCKPT